MSVSEPALDLTPIRLNKRFTQRAVVSSRGLLPNPVSLRRDLPEAGHYQRRPA